MGYTLLKKDLAVVKCVYTCIAQNINKLVKFRKTLITHKVQLSLPSYLRQLEDPPETYCSSDSKWSEKNLLLLILRAQGHLNPRGIVRGTGLLPCFETVALVFYVVLES